MSKLILPPDNASYTASRNEEVLSVKLDGGASKYRRDILNAAFNVDVSWITDADGYDYLGAFFRTATVHGSIPFTIDLILDTPELVERTACFVPGTFKLDQQRGLGYFASAQLEVTKEFDSGEAADDAAIISAYVAAHT